MAIFFGRDTKVYIGIGAGVWEIPVLEGFSFSQAAASTEITLSEATSGGGLISKRGKVQFNDSLGAADWSFTTYIRPFISTGAGSPAADTAGTRHHAVEEVLWAAFVGNNVYSGKAATPQWTKGLDHGASPFELNVDFAESNVPTLTEFDLYFSFDDAGTPQVYKLANSVITTASLDFDIEGIAQITWSGFATDISVVSKPVRTVWEDITNTDNFIRQRLSEMTLAFAGGSPDYSNIVLTGGNITFENNITFLTPEEIGIVNTPIGHVTGARTVSGTVTAYLDTATGAMADLYDALIADVATPQNSYDLDLYIGGIAGTPRLEISIPQAHLEIPSHQVEDVLSMELNFFALGTSILTTDEAVLTYVGAP